MNELLSALYANSHQHQLLAEARQARLVAQLRMPRAGQHSAQSSNLGAATTTGPAGSAFDVAVRQLAARLSRRGLWGVASAVALGGVGLATAFPGAFAAVAKKKRGGKSAKAKKAKRLCRKDGSRCKKQGKRCKAQFCLRAPFTIEARWSNVESDHDSMLFVPNEEGNDDPFPVITAAGRTCRSDGGNDGSNYPFAVFDRDAQGPGNEVATVRQMLTGTYEYWIELENPSPAGDVEVILRNANGTVLRSWTSPENPNPQQQAGWHVFDIDGATRAITSVDELIENSLPLAAHAESTDVCPL